MAHTREPGWNGLAALRRERSALAALGLLLLFAQLLLSGLSQGAMAAERLAAPALDVICHSLEDGNRLVPGGAPKEPDRSCPCLAGICLAAVHALPPEGAGAAIPHPPAASVTPLPEFAQGTVARRPIDLFARASRGPPVRIQRLS